MNLRLALILAAVVAMVLMLVAPGFFSYVFLACVVAVVGFEIAALVRAPEVPAKPPAAPLPVAIPPKPEPAVFDESPEFDQLDRQSQGERRLALAHQVERKIDKGLVLTPREIDKADAGRYELDRIGLYVWEAKSGAWPGERSVHVRHEFQLIGASRNSPSLMALEYSLASFSTAVNQSRAPLTKEERVLMASIHDYMKDHRTLHGAAGIQSAADQLLSAQAPAVPNPPAPSPALAAYETIRDRRFRELADALTIPLHVASLQVFVTINDNGDAVINERYEVVSSTGAPIDFVPTNLPADYSRVPEPPRYFPDSDQQSIEWKYDTPGATSGPARVLFDPPIGRDPISFSRKWTRFNAVYFNQSDRRDSGTPGTTEDLSFPVRYRYDRLSYRIVFPDRIHPAPFTVQCKPLKDGDAAVPDPDESAWAAQGIDWERQDGAVWLDVASPLPGYSYYLAWDLPPVDAEESSLTPWQAGTAQELNDRFLSLRDVASPYRKDALAAMQILAGELEGHFGGELCLRLFTYISRNGKGGLIEVLERHGSAISSEMVVIGRTLVGRAYRRKISLAKYESVEDKSFEKIPSEESQDRPCVAVAFPLLCPARKGRRVVVLYASTWSRETTLMQAGLVRPEPDFFTKKVVHWYANELCEAVNMKGVLQAMFRQPER
jgi:hypothetical protein